MKILSFLKNVILLSVLTTGAVFSQNYEISVALNTRNDTVLLGYYFTKGDKRYPSDTVVLKNGKGAFRGDRELPNGVYFLYSDGRLLFDFIIGDNKKFGIVADTADFINLTKFTASPDNDVFFDYIRHNVSRNQQIQQMSELYRNAASDADRAEIIAKRNTLDRESLAYIDQLIGDNHHLYVSKIIQSSIPLRARLPEPPRDDEGNVTDPYFQYRWYRAHFFDNLNIFDPDMLRTQSYEDKLFEYITIVPQNNDTICAEIDKILAKPKPTTLFSAIYYRRCTIITLILLRN